MKLDQVEAQISANQIGLLISKLEDLEADASNLSASIAEILYFIDDMKSRGVELNAET